MFGIKLKALVAMVTELCTHSISAMHAMLLRFASCIPVLILKKSDTFFLKQIIFLKSLNSMLNMLFINTFHKI